MHYSTNTHIHTRTHTLTAHTHTHKHTRTHTRARARAHTHTHTHTRLILVPTAALSTTPYTANRRPAQPTSVINSTKNESSYVSASSTSTGVVGLRGVANSCIRDTSVNLLAALRSLGSERDLCYQHQCSRHVCTPMVARVQAHSTCCAPPPGTTTGA